LRSFSTLRFKSLGWPRSLGSSKRSQARGVGNGASRGALNPATARVDGSREAMTSLGEETSLGEDSSATRQRPGTYQPATALLLTEKKHAR
jgi:hypothetical protein